MRIPPPGAKHCVPVVLVEEARLVATEAAVVEVALDVAAAKEEVAVGPAER